jgi:hypothetical protein
MNFPYNEKVKVNVVTYNMEVFHEGFIFSVQISEYHYKMMVDKVKLLDDKEEFKKLKYSIKNNIIREVEEISVKWIKDNIK